jgi:hypothetical protein
LSVGAFSPPKAKALSLSAPSPPPCLLSVFKSDTSVHDDPAHDSVFPDTEGLS